MKKNVFYKVKDIVPSVWKYYLFLDDHRMIIFNSDLTTSEYRDDLQPHLIDIEDFDEVNLTISKQREAVKSIF